MLIQLSEYVTDQANTVHHKIGHSLLIFVALMIFSVVFSALAGSTIGDTTIQFDEFTDLVIASRLSEHPLSGHTYDGSQARMPMYVTAVAYRIMRIANPDFQLLDMLPISRWFSILATIIAIWGTYLLGAKLFNPLIGLLGATLFTFSPYVLHFGHVALTQGDAFTTAPVIFTLIAFLEFTKKRTTNWLVAVSFCLALAIAAKFFLAILIPALIGFHLLLEVSKRYRHPDPFSTVHEIEKLSTNKFYTTLAIGTALLSLLAVLLVYFPVEQFAGTQRLAVMAARLAWVSSLAGILFCVLFALKKITIRPLKLSGEETYWRLLSAWPVILLLTFAIVLTLFPAHIFNREIHLQLFKRLVTFDGNTNILATSFDSIRLYVGLLLFKLGLPLGIATFFALFWIIRKSITHAGFLLVTLTLFFYGFMLVFLPLQQPFWLMSIYPLIVLSLAAFFLLGLTKLRSLRWRTVAAVFAVFACCWLVLGVVQVYPTFGYYGYETIGDRWWGDSSRGYAAIVVMTNDGSTEAIDWLRMNASNNATVISYFDDPHIMKYLDSVEPFNFELKYALQYADRNELIEELERTDYVVVRPINDIDFPMVYTDSYFNQIFGEEPVYQIYRGRGVYRMPVMQIYHRKLE